ncbi:unnamed protein product [Alopecurus aequalis]
MENNPLAAAVINNLHHLVDNPDLVQELLDEARADLNRNDVLLAEAAAHLRECLAYATELQAFPGGTEEQWAECAELVVRGATSYALYRRQRWLLAHLVGSLLFVRAVAFARSRAHLLPGVLLTALLAAVVVYISTWGGVVPGFRSFLRFSVLMLRFLFVSHRPRGGG